mgnify:CR=1 FL=1
MSEIPPESLTSIFGTNVFSDAVMRERLPRDIYQRLQRVIREGAEMDISLANVVAGAMKDWAVEKGATHFCHWFQPMTGMTAQKHDAFISPTGDGRTVMEFSGRELIQGEPDASSFPSGGLRATFEARGYTAWDCTSPVFIKRDGDNVTLFIPSAFCSYTGHALDRKTPLLRSMEALNRQALRVLRALGNTTSRRVSATLGAEQEYFLVDRRLAEKRLDLIITGRTLFGAYAPKGQEMEDHYYGPLHERVASFMNELNIELWRMGIPAKTQHNEVAPAQYEIAPVYATVNVATDHNQLTMETLHKVALRRGFVCLLHEKPFAGVNGSGKHINWSLVTDDGINLLDPGRTPHENKFFLVFLFAVVRAVDRYARLLRAAVATSGNDHRLGANEAPPAIISIFLGEQLTDIWQQLEKGGARRSKSSGELRLGVSAIPPLPKDCTDRNRTSPFAFTGNKFEFRMAGSSQNTAGPCFVLNTIVAEALREIADQIEGVSDPDAQVEKILQRYAREHKRIIYNGDNYSQAWLREAQRRGLPNIGNTVDSLGQIMHPEHIELFARQGVLNRDELQARADILLEIYCKQIRIEARTMLAIGRRQIMPAAIAFAGRLGQAVRSLSGMAPANAPRRLLKRAASLIAEMDKHLKALEKCSVETEKIADLHKQAAAYRDKVLPAMAALRQSADALEQIVGDDLWPLPTYAQMLFLR